jgi:hypothetical protein
MAEKEEKKKEERNESLIFLHQKTEINIFY